MKPFRFLSLPVLAVSLLLACEPIQPEVIPQNAQARIAASSNALQVGQSLQKGSSLTADNGNYKLTFRSDGDLVLYRNNLQQEPLWASGTRNKGATCTYQTDGNLVIYDMNTKPVWASGTQGYTRGHLTVRDDGNVAMYRDSREITSIWATNTSQTFYNPKLDNIWTAYKAVESHASKEVLNGEPWIPNLVASHVQGVAYYKDYAIFSHSNIGYSTGKLIIVNRSTNKLVHNFNIPTENLNHPGGIQVIGNFLAVPVEPDNNDPKSYILFYDLTVLNDTTPPFLLERPRIDRTTGAHVGKAGAVGLTNYTSPDGKEHYKLAVFDNGTVDMYTSNEYPLGDDRLQFMYEKSLRLSPKQVQGVCLLTSKDQNINMVGFGYDYPEDHLFLFDKDGNQLENRHFYNKYGSTIGIAGVHFRWGSGLQITTNANNVTTFSVMCTQRNFVGGSMPLNNFTPNQ